MVLAGLLPGDVRGTDGPTMAARDWVSTPTPAFAAKARERAEEALLAASEAWEEKETRAILCAHYAALAAAQERIDRVAACLTRCAYECREVDRGFAEAIRVSLIRSSLASAGS